MAIVVEQGGIAVEVAVVDDRHLRRESQAAVEDAVHLAVACGAGCRQRVTIGSL